MPQTVTELEREEIASESRHWVRISRTCNNRCVFCLDSDVQDGTFVPRAQVEEEIREGRRQGATRLILSGGEATIHPDFLGLVAYGKEEGYDHVQTITNGRMFAYRDFARRAIEAGLDEVTFSLHGHEPGLNDSLTGVEGSFAQTVAGIRNVTSTRRIIVSGDVVVNSRNIAHLREILELFIGLGIREFDILMVVPFGRASPGQGADLLPDLERDVAHLRRALELSRDPTLHVWTNRMDPRFLEGFEHLVQDPHKLHDEVRGRREILRDLVEGRPMRCAGERCSHCFIRHLCSGMRRAVGALADGVPGILLVDPRTCERGWTLLSRPRDVLWVRGGDVDDACRLDGPGTASRLWLALDDWRGIEEAERRGRIRRPERVEVRRREDLDIVERMAPKEIVLRSGAHLEAEDVSGLALRCASRILVSQGPWSTLREASGDWRDPSRLVSAAGASACVGIPACTSGPRSVEWPDPLDAAVVGEDGLVDPDAWVDHFVRWQYRSKSLRCRRCAEDARCEGLSIHLVRYLGLGVLAPLDGG